MTNFPPFKKPSLYNDVESHYTNSNNTIIPLPSSATTSAIQYSNRNNLLWLVKHSIEMCSISKARGAELLGVSLIDMMLDYIKYVRLKVLILYLILL